MDKSGFLRELQKHLVILNESEQKDILDEYTQHIDMKMENGMSETEAIRDFGTIEELASEILKAYHVDPGYGNKKRLKLVQKDEIPVQRLKKTGGYIWKGIMAPFVSAWNALKHRKETRKERRNSHLKVNADLPGLRRNITIGKLMRKAGCGMSRFIGAILLFTTACIRWLWNGCMILLALIMGACTLAGIFCMGVIAVLLLQGYPLVGITLASLGGVMCCGSITVLLFCLMRRKNGENRPLGEKEVREQEVILHA